MAEPTPNPQGGQEPTPATEPNGGAEPTPEPQGGQEPTPPSKTYTEDEFKAESEKLIAEALKTANAKSEVTLKKQLAEARAEWEKEAKMSEAEREAAAQKKAKDEFEAEKAEFAREKLVNYAGIQLVKNSLPEEIAELITASDSTEETIGEGIGKLKAAFDKAVEMAVNEKLKGKSPDTGGENNNTDPFLSGFGL